MIGCVIALLVGLVGGCAEQKKPEGTGVATGRDELTIYGALKSIFRDGESSEVVNLDAILPDTNVFGIGAMSGLRGEITIVDGMAYLSYPDGADDVRTESTYSPTEGATLLVIGEASDWHSVKISTDISFDEIDDQVSKLAASVGVDPEKPFAFRVTGRFPALQWHVIDGRRLEGGGGSHNDHLSASVLQQGEDVQGTIVGFYSAAHQGVITHMGSHTHIHSVIDEPLSSGHVDNVVLPAGSIIRISSNLRNQR